MSFWIFAALLTVGASLAVLVPLSAKPRVQGPQGGSDLRVYRDQFAELERDVERGVLAADELAPARAELGRRILNLSDDREKRGKNAGTSSSRATAAAAVLAVPLISWAGYSVLGSPQLPSQPLQARLAADPAEAPIEALVARAEAHLAKSPDDGRGWDVLAPIYLRVGRAADSVAAYRQAIRLGGASADREAGLGEALTAAAGGEVTAEAGEAFERASGLEPQNAKAAFFRAVARAQGGKLGEAVAIWRGMLATLPAASPWRPAVEQALEAAEKSPAASGAPVAQGPDAAAIEAAAALPEQDRAAMIATMVAGLDKKLRAEPRDPEGWMRLVRSYMVLGKPEAAKDARDRGLDALGRTSPDAARLMALSLNLGLAATE